MSRWMRPSHFASVAVLIGMLVATGFAVRELPRIRLENNVQTWLSPDDPEAQVLAWCRERFPEQNQVLISWTGSSLDDPRVPQLAVALTGVSHESGIRVGGLSCIDRVVTPHDILDRMTRHGVAEAEAISRLRGVLIGRSTSETKANETAVEEPSAPPIAVLVSLTDAGAVDSRASLQSIREIADHCGIPPRDLHLGGEFVTSAALDSEVLNATWNWKDPIDRPPVFLVSALVGALLAVLILHSRRLGMMVLACAYFTALVGTALVPHFGHDMNMVLIVMPTLLIVLALSAAIHVANYWRHAAANGDSHPVRRALRIGLLPCLLAAVTTGIGLISLSISPLGPIKDFGVFGSIGTLVSFVVVLIGLPAMLVVRPVKTPSKSEVNHPGWRWLGGFLGRHSVSVAVLTLLLFFAATAGLTNFQTEVKVARYFPEGSRLATDYEFLESNLAGIVPVEIAVSFNEDFSGAHDFLGRTEVIRKIGDRVRQHAEISGVLSLADFLPVTTPLADDASFLDRSHRAVRTRTAVGRVKEDPAVKTLIATDVPTGRVESPENATSEVWRILAQSYVTSDADYGELTTQVKEAVSAVLGDQSGVEFRVTGTVPLFFRAQQALLDSLIRSFCLASAVITVSMIVLLRGVRAGILSMLPNLMPIGVVFGVMSWRGQVLDIGTMLTASVALGIAVDGALHLLTWFRNAVAAGKSRAEAVVHSLQHCGPAMTQTSAVIGLSLLVLYPAELLLISRFGWVMAALIATALLSEVVFLPVLLVGPLGRLIQQTVKVARSEDTAEEADKLTDAVSPDSQVVPQPSVPRKAA